MTEQEQHRNDLPADLAALLNRHSAENASGTPDFILAEFLFATLKAYNSTVVKRADWRGESVGFPALDGYVWKDE